MNKVYIVGQSLGEINKWVFQGVYSTHDAALAKCADENFFIMGAVMDFDEPVEWSEPEFFYYPHSEPRPQHPEF
jgi:hypothetical protein